MANAEHSVHGGATAGRVGTRMGTARAVLWLVAVVLAVRQAAAVLGQPPGQRLADLETWTGENGVLHVAGSLYDTGKFTGTPFAGLVLKPLASSAERSLGIAWTCGTLLLVVALGLVVATALPGRVSRRTGLLAAPVAISLLMLSLPVRNSFHLGQTSIIPVLLVLLGCFAVRGERGAGILIGVGAALQPAVLLFAALLWLTGRRKAAVTTLGTFAACSALAWAVLPRDSWSYWVHHVAGVGLGESPDSLANQSLHGALLRFGLEGPLEIALFVLLAAAVVGVGMRRAVRYAEDGQLLLAVAVTGCVAVAVSPTAWQHQLLWVLLAVVGRVGKRGRDRLVWPAVVVLVMTLPGTMLLPNMESLFSLRDNVPLLAALAAACGVPFLSRTSPYFERPVPTEYARAARPAGPGSLCCRSGGGCSAAPTCCSNCSSFASAIPSTHISAWRRREDGRPPRNTVIRSTPSNGRWESTSSTGPTTRSCTRNGPSPSSTSITSPSTSWCRWPSWACCTYAARRTTAGRGPHSASPRCWHWSASGSTRWHRPG